MSDPAPMLALSATSEAHAQLANMIVGRREQPVRAHRIALKSTSRPPSATRATRSPERYAYGFLGMAICRREKIRRSRAGERDWRTRGGVGARGVRVGALTNASVSRQAMLQSTLGEALLAGGRPHEAIAVLRQARDLAPKHDLFDQILWDLRQADIVRGRRRSRTR